MYHYRKPDVCRVPMALPSAQYRVLGKITICRVPTKKHSANRQHSAEENTRRTHLCRVPRGQHSANSVTCATHARYNGAAVILCRVPHSVHSAKTITCAAHDRYPVATLLPRTLHCTKTVTVMICRVPG